MALFMISKKKTEKGTMLGEFGLFTTWSGHQCMFTVQFCKIKLVGNLFVLTISSVS